MTAAARSLRHTVAIDGIVHFVVHGDDVPLIAAAIDAEPTNTGSFVVLNVWFVGTRPYVHVFFLLISLLGPNLKFKGSIKGLI